MNIGPNSTSGLVGLVCHLVSYESLGGLGGVEAVHGLHQLVHLAPVVVVVVVVHLPPVADPLLQHRREGVVQEGQVEFAVPGEHLQKLLWESASSV